MTSKEVANLAGCYYTYVQQKTKQALENGLKCIELKGLGFSFELVSNSSGKAYRYVQIKSTKKQRCSTSISYEKLRCLDGFDILKTTHSVDEKVLIIEFYNTHNYSLNSIIKALYFDKNVIADKVKIASGAKKIKRWIDAYKTQGISALSDKRGAKASNVKIDEDKLIHSILGAGSKGIRDNFYGAWQFYNFICAKDNGVLNTLKMEFKDKSLRAFREHTYISYTAYARAVRRVYKSNPQVKSFIDHGFDGILQDYPVGIKDVVYPNQEWQVDATKFDFMCKVPNEMGGYDVKRVNLTAVIDVYTKKAVINLSENIDSYAQARVLYKAIEKMGMPENVYSDNGRDYTSHHYVGFLKELGINHIKAQVGQGRQKGAIERLFGVKQSAWACIPGYIGNNVSKRSDIENQTASKIDIRTSKATRINEDRLLSLDELRAVCESFIRYDYNDYEDFAEFRLDNEKLMQIKRKLGKCHIRTLQTNGIRANNYTYTSSSLWTRSLNRGDKVHVYENIDNINEVYIYKDNEFICIAHNIIFGVDAMSLEEHRQAVRAYKKANVAPVLKKIKKSKKLYEQMEDFLTQSAKDLTKDKKVKTKKVLKLKPNVKKEDNYSFFMSLANKHIA